MTDLVPYERAMEPHLPAWQDLLAPTGQTAERLKRTVLISVERLPELQNCSMQSICLSATTFAVLGLEVDGVTGQGYLIPFGGKAQPVVGYKGYNTLAHRAGLTITGGLYREGDEFDYAEGSRAFVHHKKRLGAGLGRDILAAWAVAMSPGKTPIVSVLDRDDLLAIKAKSPGAKRRDSPWNDAAIGFPAMCEKSAKRRLARSLPLVASFQRAAALETAFEEIGRHAYLREDGALLTEAEEPPMIEGQAETLDDLGPAPGWPIVRYVKGHWVEHRAATGTEWKGLWQQILDKYQHNLNAIVQYRDHNAEAFAEIGAAGHGMLAVIERMIEGPASA